MTTFRASSTKAYSVGLAKYMREPVRNGGDTWCYMKNPVDSKKEHIGMV